MCCSNNDRLKVQNNINNFKKICLCCSVFIVRSPFAQVLSFRFLSQCKTSMIVLIQFSIIMRINQLLLIMRTELNG